MSDRVSKNDAMAPSWRKSFQQIAEWLGINDEGIDGDVWQLTTDSRQLTANAVFIALPGTQAHGLDFIKGNTTCVAILTPDEATAEIQTKIQMLRAQGQRVLKVKGLSERLGAFAHWFYNAPSARLAVIGITGTNGKTSTAFYTAQLLQASGMPTAVIGTLGCGFLEGLTPSLNTTPEVVTVHRLLAEFAQKGAEAVVMEVSSHAIALGRIEAVQFHTLALTQVTRDHLDFHGSEANYQATKKQLFLKYGHSAKRWVVNVSDAVGQAICEAQKGNTCLKYAAFDKGGDSEAIDLSCEHMQFLPSGICGSVKFSGVRENCQLHLLGAFNIENVLCAIGIVSGQTQDTLADFLPKLARHLKALQPVAGRMQRIDLQTQEASKLPIVVIDYAHTPDGLTQALSAFRQHLPNVKLTCVFGCGGDRDRGKRPLMGAIAERLADQIVITSDNPRCESPMGIIEEIVQGLQHPEAAQIIEDRARAIEWAICQAQPGEGVLIAGKGHETTQQFCKEKIYFSDEAVAKAALQKRTSHAADPMAC